MLKKCFSSIRVRLRGKGKLSSSSREWGLVHDFTVYRKVVLRDANKPLSSSETVQLCSSISLGRKHSIQRNLLVPRKVLFFQLSLFPSLITEKFLVIKCRVCHEEKEAIRATQHLKQFPKWQNRRILPFPSLWKVNLMSSENVLWLRSVCQKWRKQRMRQRKKSCLKIYTKQTNNDYW